jgi:hypothetical protein
MQRGAPFLLKKDFTIKTLECIVDYRPYAMMGGEITEYQRKTIPLFLNHLEEVFPVDYAALLVARPDYVERYGLKSKNYIGRTAILKSLAPGEVTIGKNVFSWDGQKLESVTFDPFWFHLYNSARNTAIEAITVGIVPTPDAVIKVERNDQVTEKTVFVD